MITFQQLKEKTTHRSTMTNITESLEEMSGKVKTQVLEQLKKKSVIREERFGIFCSGDLVESGGTTYEVIGVGSSYIHVISKDGNTYKKWIHECTKVGKASLQALRIQDGQILWKGYLTKTLPLDTVNFIKENYKSLDMFLLLSFLTTHDKMVEESSIEKRKPLVEQTFKYSEKLGILPTEIMKTLDDTMILEAAQGNIRYSPPDINKVRNVIQSILSENQNNKYNKIIQNLIQMVEN